MVECPKDQTLQPGSWNLWTTGKKRILFACPKCSEVGLLEHGIGRDGVVCRMVQCAKLGCGFQDRIKLLGWVPHPNDTEILRP